MKFNPMKSLTVLGAVVTAATAIAHEPKNALLWVSGVGTVLEALGMRRAIARSATPASPAVDDLEIPDHSWNDDLPPTPAAPAAAAPAALEELQVAEQLERARRVAAMRKELAQLEAAPAGKAPRVRRGRA